MSKDFSLFFNAYEKGQGTARVKTYMITPVREYSNAEIREIRMRAGMTREVFASYMGVSKKTDYVVVK